MHIRVYACRAGYTLGFVPLSSFSTKMSFDNIYNYYKQNLDSRNVISGGIPRSYMLRTLLLARL